HIERTRLIVHLIDMAGLEGRNPFEDYEKINEELSAYDKKLMEKKQIIVANKMDMPNAEENLRAFKNNLDDSVSVYPISALTKAGLKQLLYGIADALEDIPKSFEVEEQVVIRPEKEVAPFEVSRADDGAFLLSGRKIERLFKMADFASDEGTQRFARQMRRLGVDEALREHGAKDGDTVRLLDFEFEFIE